MTTPFFPARFAHLERFSTWSLPTEIERVKRRQASSMADVTALYEGVVPELAEILDYLDSFPLESMPPAEGHLFNLALSVAHVAAPVEQYGQVASPGACSLERWIPIHAQ